MEFICKSKDCPYEGPEPFVLSLPEGIQLDRDNYATMYCPHCEQELVEKAPVD